MRNIVTCSSISSAYDDDLLCFCVFLPVMVRWSRSSSGWDASEETRLSSNMGICIMEKEEICLAACGESLYENTVRTSPEKPECSCKNITPLDYSQRQAGLNVTIALLCPAWMMFPHLSSGELSMRLNGSISDFACRTSAICCSESGRTDLWIIQCWSVPSPLTVTS